MIIKRAYDKYLAAEHHYCARSHDALRVRTRAETLTTLGPVAPSSG